MSDELNDALAETLSNLNETIERMEKIVKQLEAGETDWGESIRLLGEANDLALSSSKRLEQAVNDVIYGSPPEGAAEPASESEADREG